MEFKEFGNQSGRTLLLLPGTACTWQLNFKNVADDLAEKYHIIDHGFIGSSDLDQGSPVVAGLLTMLVGSMLSGACRSESRREKLKAKLQKKGAIGDGEQSLAFANDFIDSMKNLNPRTISREFYSDYITPLEDDIHVDGTAVHVVYALKMGEKYGKRYKQHFREPDIREFDMKHEVWLYDDRWRQPVLDMIDRCMEQG